MTGSQDQHMAAAAGYWQTCEFAAAVGNREGLRRAARHADEEWAEAHAVQQPLPATPPPGEGQGPRNRLSTAGAGVPASAPAGTGARAREGTT